MNGLIGRKVGMTHIFSDKGDEIPVTVLEMGPCPVVQVKTLERDGYSSAQLAFDPLGKKSEKVGSKPVAGHYAKGGVAPHRHLREFHIAEGGDEAVKVGEVMKVDIFDGVEYVSVTATSKGRGFAGVVKRHGFSGANMTHGAHEQFRHPGSMGMCVFPGRIIRGKKLPGQYGNSKVKVLNLEVVKTFPERNLLLVKGGAPGPTGGIVVVEKSFRKKKTAPPVKTGKKKR